ncbi:MAG: hypothetical protein JXR96_05075 [Deltaproteobacteria bacterium]|nr:hypothetical protein [Deltaproteobacteria bacterium]
MRKSARIDACVWVSVLLLASLVYLCPWKASAGVTISSPHPTREVELGGKLQAAHWLKPGEMMTLEVLGPTHLGLRIREILEAGRQPVPVDLTVVRDDTQQGTVRFRVNPSDERGLSAEVLIRIDVPKGVHGYRLLVFGPPQGVVLLAFTGVLDDSSALIATPGGADIGHTHVPRAPVPPKVQPAPKRTELKPPEPDIMASVPAQRPDGFAPRTTRIHYEPEPEAPVHWSMGPGTRISSAVAGALLLGASSVAISGAVQERQARDEAVQIEAGRLLDRADHSYRVAGVMFGIAGAAVLTAVLFAVLEQPATAGDAWAWRF